MEFAEKDKKFYDLLLPVVEGLGFSVVELTVNNRSDGIHISLVIFSENGVGINECAKVHRTVEARAEVLSETRNIYFEVSSPGITRNIKSADEFFIFKGKNVKILASDENEWISGVLVSADSEHITIKNEKTEREIPYSLIKKAKLDFSWEEA